MSYSNSPVFDAENARKQNFIGKRIAEIRKARKMTQADVCNALKRYDISIQPAALSRWEHGTTEPNAIQFLALYRVFELDPDFNFLEENTAVLESPLSEEEVRSVREFREFLEDNPVPGSERPNIRMLRLPLLIPRNPVLAPEDSAPYTYSWITVRETDLPYGTDFLLKVPDNSMTPLLRSGENVFCSYTHHLVPKDIGIFLFQNKLFIRSFYPYPDNEIPAVLYSCNVKTPALLVDDLSQLKIMARVLL